MHPPADLQDDPLKTIKLPVALFPWVSMARGYNGALHERWGSLRRYGNPPYPTTKLYIFSKHHETSNKLMLYATSRPFSLLRSVRPVLLAAGLIFGAAGTVPAQDLPPISVGAAVRTDFNDTKTQGSESLNSFAIDSARLFVSGAVTKEFKVVLNTEYDGLTNNVTLMDAMGQYSGSAKFNIWAGRLLPPSDRANLYGPYYSHNWGFFTDGIQDGYPEIEQGRDNGVVYFGDFKKVKVSGGVFDGLTATGNKTLIKAGRIQIDLWDAEESGYYLNSTYYGEKNILALGAAGQVQDGDNSSANGDFLLERKVKGGGAYTVESEFARFVTQGGYNPLYRSDKGGYVLASYLMPFTTGKGRFEILGKTSKADFTGAFTASHPGYSQKTNEVNLNYIIKEYDARIMAFYIDSRYNAALPNVQTFGIGLQLAK